MKSSLKDSIAKLYTVFEKYNIKSQIDGCPCCVSNEDRLKLHSKPLKELTDDDLSHFASSAMTTFGHAGDFKHFLPRIFELMSTSGGCAETFVILGKLEYANWQIWSEIEKESIREFLLSWWINLNQIAQFSSIKEKFMEIFKVLKDLPLLLSNWEIKVNTESVNNLSYMIIYEMKIIITGNKDYSVLSNPEREYLIDWLLEKKNILSKAYNYYEQRNPELSWQIANAVNILEYHGNK